MICIISYNFVRINFLFEQPQCLWAIKRVIERDYKGAEGKDLVAWDDLYIPKLERALAKWVKLLEDFKYDIRRIDEERDGSCIVIWKHSVISHSDIKR